MEKITRSGLYAILIMLIPIVNYAAVTLPSVIGNNMVLQQNTQVKIWGQAEPGEIVTVLASWSDDSVSVAAGNNGRWLTEINTPGAGGPFTLTVKGINEITLENIMAGELWIAFGQSNMEMPLKGSWYTPVDNADEAIRTALSHTSVRNAHTRAALRLQRMHGFGS